MKKRLIHSQDISQLYQAVPLNFNEENDWRERGYSNYTNIAWVTPVEARMIMQAFGPAYIEQGAKEDSFYVTPKYLEPEVEAMIWRLRGTTPIEGNDRTTYAATKSECSKCDGTGEIDGQECSKCYGQGDIIKEAQHTEIRHVNQYSWENSLHSLEQAINDMSQARNSIPKLDPSATTAAKQMEKVLFELTHLQKLVAENNEATASTNKRLIYSQANSSVQLIEDAISDLRRGMNLAPYRTPEDAQRFLSGLVAKLTQVLNMLRQPTQANKASTTKLAGKCPGCKGKGWTFNKEDNKKEKCKDCRATGEMTDAKRQRMIDDKKKAASSKSRLIKS